MYKSKLFYTLSLLLLGSLLFTSCGGDKKGGQQRGPQGPRAYKAIEVENRDITLHNEYPVSIEGEQNVEIRPKVNGFITKIHVDEGAFVRKGQLLFEIEAPQFEQDLRSARANIEIAQSNVNAAQLDVDKIKPLVEKNIISSFELDNANLKLASAKAVLKQAQAQLTNAQSNFNYTRITSPVSGVIGMIPHKIGSLVSGTTPEALTTVSNISKIYAYFSLNEKQILELGIHEGSVNEVLGQQKGIQLKLANGDLYQHEGKIEAVSGLINSATGAITARATFANPDNIVRSGSSGTLIIPQYFQGSIVIPQRATFEIQGQKFVYVIDGENKAKSQAITVLSNNDGVHYVVNTGLKAGDKVVLEGVHTVKNGDEIIPEMTVFNLESNDLEE